MDFYRTAHRLSTVAFTLTLVASVILAGVGPGSPVGVASAEWSEDCSVTDSLLGAAYNTLMGTSDGCRWIAGSQADYENVSKTDAYASALSVKDSTDSYVTSVNNFMANTRTVAYSKAKISVVNDLNNGTTVSSATANVNETVRDYYTRMQKEALTDWNQKVTELKYASETGGVSLQIVRPDASSDYRTVGFNSSASTNVTVSLLNGTNMTVKGVVGEGTEYYPVDGGTGYDFYIQAQDPDTSAWTTVLDARDYRGDHESNYSPEYSGIVSDAAAQSQQVIDNMDPYVEEVYAQYKVGQIDSTDLAMSDPSVIAQEASTSLNSTGYYSHASIMLASLGASGNVNASHTIETGDGTILNGTLYYSADDVPADGWATNQTYNVSNWNGTFYMAVQKDTGGATVVDLSNYGENFTITRATNVQTGESLNATQVQTYTYDSTNASKLAEEIDRLRQLREEYENQATSGGSGWGGLGGDDKVIIALAAIGLILAATRN